jgi:hypothetical protein
MRQAQGGHLFDHPGGHHRRPCGVGVGQDDGQLLAAIARHDVGAAHHALLHGPRHGLQADVTLRVAVAVVELLEMIDIDHQHPQRMLAPERTGARVCQALLEVRPVGNAQQPIGA